MKEASKEMVSEVTHVRAMTRGQLRNKLPFLLQDKQIKKKRRLGYW